MDQPSPRAPRRRRRWRPAHAVRIGRALLGFALVMLAAPAEAHLIDEIAESLLCDIETADRMHIRATWYLEAGRVEAYFDAAQQVGQAPARSAAAFALRLAEGFAIDGCAVAPAVPAEVAVPGRTGYRGFSLQIRCTAPRDKIELRRVDVSRERTRATLYVSLRVADAPVRRFLLPPRLSSLVVPLLAESTPTSVPKANHGGDDEDEPLVTPRVPGDEFDLEHFPAPGETGGFWQRMPPASICLGWAEEGARHLLGGLDHVLFLVALALAARSLGALGLLVAAFSLGHMLTMTAALAWHWPRLAAVEVAIGATICWSSWQAARPDAARTKRWLAVGVWACGLVHGAAFGAELRSVLGSSDGLLWPVLSFGVGLDLAQTFAAGLLFAAWTPIRRLRGAPSTDPRQSDHARDAASIGGWAGTRHVPRQQRLAALALGAAGLAYAAQGALGGL